MYLSLYKCHTILNINNFNEFFKLDSVNLPTFVFWKIILASLGPFHNHIHFRISLSIDISVGILIGIVETIE